MFDDFDGKKKMFLSIFPQTVSRRRNSQQQWLLVFNPWVWKWCVISGHFSRPGTLEPWNPEPWNPGTRNPGPLEPGTLEPWNLLLGCNAMSMQLFHETMTRAIRDTKEFWWLRLVGGWRVDGNGLVLPGGHVFVATLQMRVALGGIGGWQYVFFSSDHCLQCHVSSLHTQNGWCLLGLFLLSWCLRRSFMWEHLKNPREVYYWSFFPQ